MDCVRKMRVNDEKSDQGDENLSRWVSNHFPYGIQSHLGGFSFDSAIYNARAKGSDRRSSHGKKGTLAFQRRGNYANTRTHGSLNFIWLKSVFTRCELFLLHKLSMNDSLHYWFCFVTSFTKESMQLFWIRNVWKLRTYIQIQKKSKEGTSRVS